MPACKVSNVYLPNVTHGVVKRSADTKV